MLRGCIDQHLEAHRLMKDSQHGFVKGRLCLTNLIKFEAEARIVDVVCINFSEASDKVPIGRLIRNAKAKRKSPKEAS